MMNPRLQERFDQILGFIKNPNYNLTVEINLAAARELVDTLLSESLLTPDEYRAYQAQITSAKLVASGAETHREIPNPGF